MQSLFTASTEKVLRSGIYPPVTVLYRREGATYVQDGHTQRIAIEGDIEDLQSPMLHDDRKPFRRWFNSQSRYTELEAQKLLAADPAEARIRRPAASLACYCAARDARLLLDRSWRRPRWLGRVLLCVSAGNG